MPPAVARGRPSHVEVRLHRSCPRDLPPVAAHRSPDDVSRVPAGQGRLHPVAHGQGAPEAPRDLARERAGALRVGPAQLAVRDLDHRGRLRDHPVEGAGAGGALPAPSGENPARSGRRPRTWVWAPGGCQPLGALPLRLAGCAPRRPGALSRMSPPPRAPQRAGLFHSRPAGPPRGEVQAWTSQGTGDPKGGRLVVEGRPGRRRRPGAGLGQLGLRARESNAR